MSWATGGASGGGGALPAGGTIGQVVTNTGPGTGNWQNATGGAPSGAAGGDLTGSTYPNPVIAAGAVTLAKMANLAANSFIGNNTGSAAVPLALTVAQAKSLLAITEGDVANLTADLAAKQPLDSDLTTIAAQTATTDNVIQSVAGAWSSRTPAQLKATLALVKADVGLSNVDNTADSAKVLTESQITGLVADLAARQSTTLTSAHILVGNGSNVATDVALSGDATLANTGAMTLKNTGPGATGPAGSTTVAPVVTIDAQGRVTALTTATIALVATGDATGTLPGALTLASVGPGATGPLGSATTSAVVTIDAKGRVTGLTAATIAIPESAVTGLVADLAARVSTTLTSAHILVGNGSNVATDVAVTGDVTITNAGVTAIGSAKVTNAMLAGSIDLTNKAATSPTFSGTVTAPAWTASGLTGAVQASRYAGATTTGAPTTGTWAVGDYVISQAGKVYICTVAGGAGTFVFVDAGAGSGGPPTGSAGGDLTGSTYPNPVIAAGAVTLAKMANLAANSILGNNTGSSATPIAMTVAQTKTLLAIAESDVTNLTTDLGALQTLSALESAQITAQQIANTGYFVIDGLALAPNATPTKLDMASGHSQFNTTALTSAAQTAIATTITSMADAANPKWVAVELDSAGVVQFNQGTAAANPVYPTATATRVVLGWLYIPANATNVDTLLTTSNGLAKLIDARTFGLGTSIPTTVTFSNVDATIDATTRIQAQIGTMSASRVATLPLAASVPAGSSITLLDVSGTVSATNFLSLGRAGADLINGASGAVFMLQAYGSITVISDGVSKWTFPLGVILPVARGGTSVTTLLNHGVLLGAGTGGITAVALDASTTKYLQSGGASAGPVWATINVTDIPTAAPLASPALTGTPAIAAATGTSLALTGALTAASTAVTGALTSSGGGVGYATGAGGTVTQITSRTTTVINNNLCGNITLFAAVLNADTTVTFTLTNSFIAANDILVAYVVSGAAVQGAYTVNGRCGAGTAQIDVHNHTPTNSASESPVIKFFVFKGVTT